MSAVEPVAIVSMGCIYPGANNPEELWNLCLKGENVFKNLSKDRWNIEHHYSPDRELADKTYSKLAAEISQETYQGLIAANNLDDYASRLEVYLHHSLEQVFADFKVDHSSNRLGFILGLMSSDEDFNHAIGQNRIPDIIKKIREKTIDSKDLNSIDRLDKACNRSKKSFLNSRERYFSSVILQDISNRFGIKGTRFLVDAACASSLCSIDVGVELLQANIMDTVIVGGAESNLSPGMYAIFSQVGALAEDKSLPFDVGTQGLVQGEGAGLFAIQKLSTALKNKNKIHALIVGSDGSSDGKTSSLFQPNPAGQAISYERVHENLKEHLTHMEAHGTGTQIGDKAESASVAQYFKNQTVPMSSIKSLIGHTKGAAGAAGLIKSIFMMKNKMVLGTSGPQSPIDVDGKVMFCNENFHLDSKASSHLFGVSAFGFGGTNYHLAVQDYNQDEDYETSFVAEGSPTPSLIVGEYEMDYKDFNSEWFMSPSSPYRLPPQSIDKIDKAQLLAVQVAYEAIKKAGIPQVFLPKKDTVVISASILGLDLCGDLAGRLQVCTLQEKIKEKPGGLSANDVERIVPLLDSIKDDYQRCAEDHAPGLLNNVIAGRVCQALDLKGRSYNIESGLHSKETALFMANLEIQNARTPLVFVIYFKEREAGREAHNPIIRDKVGCCIVANQNFARENFLRPLGEIHV